MAALSDHGPVASSILGNRVDYVSALIDGRAVLETARSGIAAQEVMDLWAGLKERLSENAKGRNSTKGARWFPQEVQDTGGRGGHHWS